MYANIRTPITIALKQYLSRTRDNAWMIPMLFVCMDEASCSCIWICLNAIPAQQCTQFVGSPNVAGLTKITSVITPQSKNADMKYVLDYASSGGELKKENRILCSWKGQYDILSSPREHTEGSLGTTTASVARQFTTK